ncbi:hypothetical protein CEXT_26621 [Caerostris extrusa]|uniref:Uncharacterized protein n=1 Tax=Caerostris extrusa TaxID=172846 RepID=A0AAV4PNW8_CAEEX|nr:hypothetical protein CEXT_26621 [Caerostris extrusa]
MKPKKAQQVICRKTTYVWDRASEHIATNGTTNLGNTTVDYIFARNSSDLPLLPKEKQQIRDWMLIGNPTHDRLAHTSSTLTDEEIPGITRRFGHNSFSSRYLLSQTR